MPYDSPCQLGQDLLPDGEWCHTLCASILPCFSLCVVIVKGCGSGGGPKTLSKATNSSFSIALVFVFTFHKNVTGQFWFSGIDKIVTVLSLVTS